MVTARKVDPFRETYWNLLQVVAWIETGDRALVARCSDQVSDYGSHWSEVTLPDGRKELAEVPSDRPGLWQIGLTAISASAGTGNSFTQIERQFLDALAQEHIEVWGLANGDGSHRKIPPIEATELAIIEDRPRGWGVCLQPKDPLRAGTITWMNVRIRREEALSAWPDLLANTTPSISPTAQDGVASDNFSKAKLKKWYVEYVAEHVGAGTEPTVAEQNAAASHAMSCSIPRDTMRRVRRENAPAEWKKYGRRPKAARKSVGI